MYQVIIEKNGKEILKKDIKDLICRIGRSPFSDVVLNEPYFSYEHLIIIEIFGHFFVVDRSLNGLFLNGKRLKRDSVNYLDPDSILSISEYSIRFKKSEIYHSSKTMILFENFNNGIAFEDIVFIGNRNNIVKNLSDDEFAKKEILDMFLIDEVYKDDMIRIIKLESGDNLFYSVFFPHSRYFNYSFLQKKKWAGLNRFDIFLLLVLISVFFFSVSLLFYICLM